MEKKETLINSITVPTDAEIRNTFEMSRGQFFIPETAGFTIIQVPYGADAAARTRARTLADSLVREIGGNATRFDQVAVRAQTANSGFMSDRGLLPRSREAQERFGQALTDAIFSLNVNQVSGLIEGINAFQIVKITTKAAGGLLELTDAIPDHFLPGVPAGTRITVRDYIGQALLTERQQAIIAQATEELIAELRAIRPVPFQRLDRNVNW